MPAFASPLCPTGHAAPVELLTQPRASRVGGARQIVSVRSPRVLVVGELPMLILAARLTAQRVEVRWAADPTSARRRMREADYNAIVVEPHAGGDSRGVSLVSGLRGLDALLVIAPIEGDRDYAVVVPGGSVVMREMADERIEALVLRFIRNRHL